MNGRLLIKILMVSVVCVLYSCSQSETKEKQMFLRTSAINEPRQAHLHSLSDEIEMVGYKYLHQDSLKIQACNWWDNVKTVAKNDWSGAVDGGSKGAVAGAFLGLGVGAIVGGGIPGAVVGVGEGAKWGTVIGAVAYAVPASIRAGKAILDQGQNNGRTIVIEYTPITKPIFADIYGAEIGYWHNVFVGSIFFDSVSYNSFGDYFDRMFPTLKNEYGLDCLSEDTLALFRSIMIDMHSFDSINVLNNDVWYTIDSDEFEAYYELYSTPEECQIDIDLVNEVCGTFWDTAIQIDDEEELYNYTKECMETVQNTLYSSDDISGAIMTYIINGTLSTAYYSYKGWNIIENAD